VNRQDWQQIAEEKLLAAGALLGASQWAAAYYLAGYSVECGLKSCILNRLASSPELIFEKKTFSEKCWTHDIVALVELAGRNVVGRSRGFRPTSSYDCSPNRTPRLPRRTGDSEAIRKVSPLPPGEGQGVRA
jgi:hypothetical protein